MPTEEQPTVEQPTEEQPTEEQPTEEQPPNLDQSILDELKKLNETNQTIDKNINDSFHEEKTFNSNFNEFKENISKNNQTLIDNSTYLNETNEVIFSELQVMNEKIEKLEGSSNYQVSQTHIFISVALAVAFCYILYRVLKYFTY